MIKFIGDLFFMYKEKKTLIIQQLLQEYDIKTAEDIQVALKDLPGGTDLLVAGLLKIIKMSVKVT